MTTRPYALPGGTLRRSFTLLGRGIASHPGSFAVAIGASAVYGVATVASGWLLGRVTDDLVVPLLQGGSELGSRDIWLAGLTLAGVALVLAVSVALRRTYAGAAAIDVQADHRRAVSRRYLELPMSWHRGRPTGELLSHASADAEAAGGVFVPLPFALGVVVMLVMAGVAMLAANVYLGIIGLAILPVVLAINSVYRRLMGPAISHAQAERARVADVAHASFEAAAVVKTLGTAGREVTGFASATDDLRAANTVVGRIRAVFDAAIDLVPALATLLVLVVGADQIAGGHARPGDVVTASFLLTVMTFPVRAIGFVLGDIPRSLVGHGRIAGVVDARDLVRGGTGTPVTREPGEETASLALRGVQLRVPTAQGDVTLLDGVSLTIPRGERTAVVGTTGAGKSTLLDVMAGLTPHTRGRVELDGRDVATMAHEDVAAELAYVAQEAFVFDDSVRANVTLHEPGTPEPTDEEVWRALELARVADVVRALPEGLDTQLGERGTSLSGGQRQRLAIARALVRRPRVLLLDDATSALDPAVEQEILAGLAELADGGPTVVMVAYRPATILGADRVVHLEQGAVVAVGDVETLLQSDPGFAALLTAYEKDRS